MGVIGAANVRVTEKVNTAVLATLAVISRITYLLLIFKSEADPGEVYCFLPPRAPDPLHWRRRENIF